MMKNHGTILVYLLRVMMVIVCGTFVKSDKLLAQDTTSVKSDTSLLKLDESAPVEIELGEIKIEAVADKPSVQIIPKRRIPELGEMEYVNRSFDKELKKGPDKPFLIKRRPTKPLEIEKKTVKKNKSDSK